MGELLQVTDLTKRFGGLIAVNHVTFSVREGEILSVIGPNGAGKSTLFKLISSFLRPTSGEVQFKGERISGLAPHIAARKGVVRTFQETTIFKGMSVRDNVIIAHHLRSKASLAGFYFGSAVAQNDQKEFARSADEIVNFVGLGALGDGASKQSAAWTFARLGNRDWPGDESDGAAARRAIRRNESRGDATQRSSWCATCAGAASRSFSSSTICRR